MVGPELVIAVGPESVVIPTWSICLSRPPRLRPLLRLSGHVRQSDEFTRHIIGIGTKMWLQT